MLPRTKTVITFHYKVPVSFPIFWKIGLPRKILLSQREEQSFVSIVFVGLFYRHYKFTFVLLLLQISLIGLPLSFRSNKAVTYLQTYWNGVKNTQFRRNCFLLMNGFISLFCTCMDTSSAHNAAVRYAHFSGSGTGYYTPADMFSSSEGYALAKIILCKDNQHSLSPFWLCLLHWIRSLARSGLHYLREWVFSRPEQCPWKGFLNWVHHRD